MKKEIVLLNEQYCRDHLDHVSEDMKLLGSPTIHVAYSADRDLCCALEGTHRLRAAEILGIPVKIEEIECDETILSAYTWSDVESLSLSVFDITDNARSRWMRDFCVNVDVI